MWVIAANNGLFGDALIARSINLCRLSPYTDDVLGLPFVFVALKLLKSPTCIQVQWSLRIRKCGRRIVFACNLSKSDKVRPCDYGLIGVNKSQVLES